MNEDTLNNLEQLFLALSDKTRLSLLGLMSGGEVPVGDLADSLGVSQPKISRHLAYLRNAGLVSTRRDGKWIYYAIEMPSDPAACHVLAETLRSLGGYAAAPIVTRGFPDMQEPFADEYVPQEIEIFLL
jgi:DNA-binding transcriptional ArsR family regulator